MAKQKYLLDTNICISLLKGKFNIRKKVENIGIGNCFVSEITIAELFYGASKSQRKEKQIADVYEILKLFKVVPIFKSLELYGDVKAKLESDGNRIDDFDLLIGVSAETIGAIMVTGNIKHFQRIPDIQIENWNAE